MEVASLFALYTHVVVHAGPQQLLVAVGQRQVLLDLYEAALLLEGASVAFAAGEEIDVVIAEDGFLCGEHEVER